MSRDLEDLAHAITTWSEERPQWQQQALRMLARQEPIGDKEARAFSDSAEREAAGLHVDVKALKTADFLGSENRQPVRLVSITDPQSVNALTWSDGLTFEPHGITVVYGENGSGKSGYARIFKKVTRARHSADVLTNVFKPPTDQSARLTVSLAFDKVQLNWPSDHPDFLSQVSFYDNECATRYVSADTEVAYRPSAIALLDDLVGLSGSVRCALEARRPTHSNSMQDLPVLPAGSRAYEFVMLLSADTTRLDIDLASELPADAEARLAALHKRITNLESDDLDRRRAALIQLVQSLQDLAAHITQTRETLSDSRVVAMQQARSAFINARKAADAVSAVQFTSEPIKGVGSPSWQILWDAAKRFSVTQAYSGHEYPVLEIEGEPAHCVLCHQKLSDPAAARLRSFQEYVTADTERTARRAQEKFQTLSEGSRTLEIFNTRVELALQQVEAADEAAHSELRSELQALEDRRKSIVETLDRGLDEIDQLPGVNEFVAAKALSKESQRQLEDLKADDRQGQLTQLRREEAEICGRQILQNSRQAIENRISSLQQVQVIDKAIRLTDTRGVTRRAADLTRSHVSDVLKHHFSQETVRLDLDTVRLADAGGGKGNLRHRAKLVGAVQNAPLHAVLSEGEQTALGLAGFLTEVESDSTGSAVVFDVELLRIGSRITTSLPKRPNRLLHDHRVRAQKTEELQQPTVGAVEWRKSRLMVPCLGNRVVWRGVLLRRTAVTLFEPSDGSGVEGAGGVPQIVLFGSNLMREPGGLATTEASFCLGVGTMEADPS